MARPPNPDMTEANLRDMYWGSGMSLREIADRVGLADGSAVLYHMRKYGIERRDEGGQRVEYATHFISKGYEKWADWISGEQVGVHQLAAIADGSDPYEVFSDGKVVHHLSGHPRDNRQGNFQVMTRAEHNREHFAKGVEA